MGRATKVGVYILLKAVLSPFVSAILCCWIGIFLLKNESIVFQALFLYLLTQHLLSVTSGLWAIPFIKKRGRFIGYLALGLLLQAFNLVAFAAFTQFLTQMLIGRPLLADGSALAFIGALMAALSRITLPGLEFISPHFWNLILGVVSSILASYLWEWMKRRSKKGAIIP